MNGAWTSPSTQSGVPTVQRGRTPGIPLSQISVAVTKVEGSEVSLDVIVVPDGGFEAWRTVAGAWLILLGTFGYSYTFGVYEDFYSREYLHNHSPSSISQRPTNDAFPAGPFCGKVFDDGGFHVIEITGCVIFTFSVFMLSLAKPEQYYQIFLAQGLGMGIGLGLTFVPTLGIIVHHFKRRRGLASGIALSGASLGATFFPIIDPATAYILPGCFILGNCLMRTRLPPRSKRPDTRGPDIKSFFFDTAYVWSVLGALFGVFGLYFPVIYIQLFSVQHNVDETLAFYSLPILNGASAVGRIFGNHLADLHGPFNIQMLCSFFAGAVVWAMLGVHNGPSLIVVSILYGILSGAWLSLCFACFSSLARGPEEVGARVGVALAVCSIGTLVSSPIQGALLTDKFTWINPIAFSGVRDLLFLRRAVGADVLRA
ncbi:major facilitator superfamily domain-containing protein [Mycena sp. CBHHK59/15]|nr:major facilitator superfamily domain-containing protein [Mycena sp. CBHHK59/15]